MAHALRDLAKQYLSMAHRDRMTYPQADLHHWGAFLGFGEIPWNVEDELTIENI